MSTATATPNPCAGCPRYLPANVQQQYDACATNGHDCPRRARIEHAGVSAERIHAMLSTGEFFQRCTYCNPAALDQLVGDLARRLNRDEANIRRSLYRYIH
jgi:hypothetical protein